MKGISLAILFGILCFFIGLYANIFQHNADTAIEHFEERLKEIDTILMGFGMSEINSDITLKQLIDIYFERNTEARPVISYEIHNLCSKYNNVSNT